MKLSHLPRLLLCLSLLLALILSIAACGAIDSPAAESATETSCETSPDTPAPDTEAATIIETKEETMPETVIQTTPPAESDTAVSPLSLTIVSYNIAAGRQVGYSMRKLAADLKSVNADIVGIQEVDQNCDRSGNIDTMKLLSRTSGMEHYAFFKGIDLGAGEYGVAILSKYPILETERVELPSAGHEQRVVGRALIDVNGTPINFFVTHLSYEDTAVREGQFAFLSPLLAEHAPYVLVGDFNTADYDEFAPLAGTAMVNNHDHSLATFPGSGKGIDNIVYTTDCWRFDAPAVLESDHSDHYMLYAQGHFTLVDTNQPAEETSLDS